MNNSVSLFYKFFKNGHTRSVKAKRNIIASFFVQGSGVFITFLMVRMTLEYLDQTNYGIWLTISSTLAWFSFFDIGLGNGLRNKLAEALAQKDYEIARVYLSTTYVILSIVITLVAIIFFVVNRFIDWPLILNTDRTLLHELSQLAVIVFGFFFLTFVVEIITVVLIADQRPTVANLMGPLADFIALVIIYVLTKTTKGSLIYFGLTLSVTPLLVMIFASIYLYRKDYKLIAPSLKIR